MHYVVTETKVFARSCRAYEYPPADVTQPFFDRPPAIGSSFSLHILSIRGCSTKLVRVSSWGFVFSTENRLVLIAVFKSRFTSSLRALRMLEVILVRIPSTRSLCATIVSSSFRRAYTLNRLPTRIIIFFFFVTCSSSL